MKHDIEVYMYLKSIGKIVSGLELEIEDNKKEIEKLAKKQKRQQLIITLLIMLIVILLVVIGVKK